MAPMVKRWPLMIDTSVKDLAKSSAAILNQKPGQDAKTQSQSSAGSLLPPNALLCFSVRTAFDLYLQERAFPRGSRVLLSAITIPDMIEIVVHHGLLPHPLDIDVDSLGVDPEVVDAAFRSNGLPPVACAVFAHLWGRRMDMSVITEICHNHGVDVLEDAAEAYHPGFRGDPASDIVFLSFGSIKHNTAHGGGVALIKDEKLLEALKIRYSAYPQQTHKAFAKRLAKNALLYTLLNHPPTHVVIRGVLEKVLGKDPVWIQARGVEVARTFKNSQEAIAGIRQRPSEPLIKNVHRRWNAPNMKDFEASQLMGRIATTRLAQFSDWLTIPGMKAHDTTNFWLFPVMTKGDRSVLQWRLAQQGVMSFHQSSQLQVVDVPAVLRDKVKDPAVAIEMMRSVLYLPIHRLTTSEDIEEICRALKKCLDPLPSMTQSRL